MTGRRWRRALGAIGGIAGERYSLGGRAPAILGLFTPEQSLLGIGEIAETLGLSRYATHRYVITLVAFGYLEQAAGRKYRLSRTSGPRRIREAPHG